MSVLDKSIEANINAKTNKSNDPTSQLAKKVLDKKQKILELDFSSFKYLKTLNKNWQFLLGFDFSKLPPEENLNKYFIEIIDFLSSKDYYIKWLCNLKIWKHKILDYLYRANIKKAHLWKNTLILWEVLSCHEDKYLPQIKSKNWIEFCELEFKIWQNYNIDEIITNLWNWWWKAKNWVKLWFNYNAIFITLKYCIWELSPEQYLQNLAKYCFTWKKFKTIEEIKNYLQSIWFLKFVWTNLSLQVAKSIPAKNWENSLFEIKSKNVLLDVAPKWNNTQKKIDMYVYWNTTFNVLKWETLLVKHPSTNWTPWFKLNWEKIEPKAWEDKLSVDKIVGQNIKIINHDDWTIELVSEIDGFLIGFDLKKPQNKFYVDTKKELKGWVNMKTWIVNDEVDWDRDIKWNIETDYTFTWKELSIKWDIENWKNLLISWHNKSSVKVDIDWTVYSWNIFCQSPWEINIKKLGSNSFIYAPFADLNIQEVQFWCVIIAKSVKIKKSINHELILSSKTEIDELEAWSKIITIFSKENVIHKVNWDESSKLELYCHYTKIRKVDINTLKIEIAQLEQSIKNIILKNSNLALLNQYYRFLELQELDERSIQENLELAKLKDLVSKNELNNEKVEQLKFMTRSAQARIDEYNRKIDELKKSIWDYQKIIEQNRQICIEDIKSWVPLVFWNIQRNILKEISKDIKIAWLKYCKNTKEIILDMINTTIEDIKRWKDDDYKQRAEKKATNYDLHFN